MLDTGVTLQTVSNLEMGRHIPATATLSKIAGAFGVSLAVLLAGEPGDEAGD